MSLKDEVQHVTVSASRHLCTANTVQDPHVLFEQQESTTHQRLAACNDQQRYIGCLSFGCQDAASSWLKEWLASCSPSLKLVFCQTQGCLMQSQNGLASFDCSGTDGSGLHYPTVFCRARPKGAQSIRRQKHFQTIESCLTEHAGSLTKPQQLSQQAPLPDGSRPE